MQLIAVEAKWAEFASWTAETLGARTDSTYWLDRSYSLSSEAGKPSVTAYIVMRKAQQAVDRMSSSEALDLANQARLMPHNSDRDLALSHIRLAQAHSLVRDSLQSRSAIERAYQLVAKADALGDDESADTIGKHCTRSYVQLHEGFCRLRLGEPDRAIDILLHTLEAWPTNYRQDEAVGRAWLACAYAATGNSRDAGLQGLATLEAAVAVESVRAMRTLGQLSVTLRELPACPESDRFQAAYRFAARSRRM
ncbi:hypothetical protein [Polymorphospora sp. NPDC050346]|uniref:hypothetical protein n=1 Tax=Polymorphospora sp. NPDC050346 TaxID=3155780 RepID=UPI0033D412DD